MAVAGIWIYAVIAAGIGALGTDTGEEIVQRRIKPAMTYQFMITTALYSFAIYTESIWTKVAMLLLCSLLAYALWQKVRDHIPFLLDPTQYPPPRLALSDGLFVVFTFFVGSSGGGGVDLHASVGARPGAGNGGRLRPGRERGRPVVAADLPAARRSAAFRRARRLFSGV